MRRNRLILLICWILSLILISFYGGVISYSLFAFFTLIPLISLFYILFVYIFFKIYQDPGGHSLTCSKTSDFYFTLQNETPITFSNVRVSFFSSFSTISGLDDKTEYTLISKSGIRRKTDLICRYRGEYEVGIKKVSIGDPLRLFTFTYTNNEPFKVSVKPGLVYTECLKISERVMNSMKDSSVPSSADILSREYIPGDDLRLVNWKQSASSNKLMVRKQTGEEQSGIGIIMDSCRYSDSPFLYLPLENKLIELTLSLSLFFNRKSIPVRVLCRGISLLNIDAGGNGFDNLYEKMSAFVFKPENTQDLLYSDILSEGSVFKSNCVFLLIHTLSKSADKLIKTLSKNNISVFVYIVSNEKNPPENAYNTARFEINHIGTEDDLKEVL